jgi:hypothetical protein
MHLRAPRNFGGATILGHKYEASDGDLVEVKDHTHITELRSHRFIDPEPAPSEASKKEAAAAAPKGDEFDGMNRLELFAWGKAHGCRMPTPITLDQQKALAREHVEKFGDVVIQATPVEVDRVTGEAFPGVGLGASGHVPRPGEHDLPSPSSAAEPAEPVEQPPEHTDPGPDPVF